MTDYTTAAAQFPFNHPLEAFGAFMIGLVVGIFLCTWLQERNAKKK